jgi:thymidine phosphorylase
LPSAPDRQPVPAAASGFVQALHAERIGRAAVGLGAGRGKLDDVIDPGVGIEVMAPVGVTVREGDAVLMVHHHGGRGLEHAMPLLAGAVRIGDAAPPQRPIVVDRIGQED